MLSVAFFTAMLSVIMLNIGMLGVMAPFTRVGSDLARKRYTLLERLVREKDCSLLRTFVNYG
jgi:hypothetical protein